MNLKEYDDTNKNDMNSVFRLPGDWPFGADLKIWRAMQ